MRAFDQSGGEDYIGGKVPVENSAEAPGPGSRDLHWRESVFGGEVMTWIHRGVRAPLSNITLQSLFDLGYLVDASLADPYVIPETPALSAGDFDPDRLQCTLHGPILMPGGH